MIINGLYWILKIVKKRSKKRAGLRRMGQKVLYISALVAQTGADIDTRALVTRVIRQRIAHQSALDETLYQSPAMIRAVDLAQYNRRHFRPSQGG